MAHRVADQRPGSHSAVAGAAILVVVILTVDHITKSVGQRVLFADAFLRIGARDRIAHAGAKPGNDVLNRIAGLVVEGKLRPDVGTILPLREARQAHELIQTGHTRGKIVLRIKEQ